MSTATATPPTTTRRDSLGRRASRQLRAHPKLPILLLLALPVGWLVVAYIGSLTALFLNSLYQLNPFTFDVVKQLTFDNFKEILTTPVYRQIALRTVLVAATVTIIDAVIAVPLAFYMAKVAGRRVRNLMVVGVLMPLWAGYLVKAYAWRAVLDPAGGIMKQWFGWSPGFGLTATVIVLAYLWLPYMVLPIYAGLDRLPNSLLEASSDLGGKAGRTFASVVLPLLMPAIIAGSIFTFSLSMGDYIAVQIVGGTTQLIGNVVFANFGSNNIPLAAAFAVVPVLVMVGYLLLVRKTGAFENL